MSLSYSDKQIRYVFNNPRGFNGSNTNTIEITNVKSTLRVSAIGNLLGVRADISLIGLSTELLAILSHKAVWNRTANAIQLPDLITVQIFINEERIFKGLINTSYTNMNSLPEPILYLSAVTSGEPLLDNYPAFSVKGNIKLVDAVRAILAPYNYSFNISKSAQDINLINPHYLGSSWQKVQQICAEFFLALYLNNDIVSIWPMTGKNSELKPYVSPNTGLVGYPVFNSTGIQFQTTYSSLLSVGRVIDLETSLASASGEYLLITVEHVLSSWIDNGAWYTLCQATGYEETEK